MKRFLNMKYIIIVTLLTFLVTIFTVENVAISSDNNYFDSLKFRIGCCESNNIHEGKWGDNGKAYGIYQFHQETFIWMAGLSGRPELKRKSKSDQEWLFDWALKNGYEKHWTCYKKVKNAERSIMNSKRKKIKV